MSRPIGLSAGAVGLLLAWAGGAAIARLTGATPVVIVLAAGLVLFVIATAAGLLALRSVTIGSPRMPAESTQGEPFTMSLQVDAKRPVWVEVRAGDHQVASGWSSHGGFVSSAVMQRRGSVEQLRVTLRSAGAAGLVWWARPYEIAIDEHLVAAVPNEGDVIVERSVTADLGDNPGPSGAVAGQIDGVRQWREGDSEKFVHWASTIRSGELVVHDRRGDAAERWTVRAHPGTADPDREAGAVRHRLEQGLRTGARVGVAIGDGEHEPIDDVGAAARWSAVAALGPRPTPAPARRSWPRSPEPETTASLSARWWAAAATVVALAMLCAALDYSLMVIVMAAGGTFAAAMVSSRTLTTGQQPSVLTRGLVALGAVAALVLVVAASGRFGDLPGFLRGPLPQVLIVLIVLHGFECHDRRTIRVGLGVSAVVVMYASGFIVDDGIGFWLFAWAVCFGVALARLGRPTAEARRATVAGGARAQLGRLLPNAATVGGGLAATVVILAVVPVPSGPANLTLPTFIEDSQEIGSPGAIAGPDGTVRDGGETGESQDSSSDRAPAGQAGGYTGFAQEMDTSVRGELSDEIVMRVRAPEPDFWRGQTFADFDGRRWYADPEQGSRHDGPNINLPSTIGDIRLADDVVIEQFVQTYYLEVDMPNLVFHAGRPVQVIIDADVWARPDGAIRASTVLPEGSIYTVVSARANVDAPLLQRQGLIAERLTERGRQAFDRYLDLPTSTSPETVALANELAAGADSTYDVVRRYESWMSQNVEYDLEAPLPDAGEDAVHDFLFDTRLGFCEQIASSLTIMLRTQGVPARLVTGYLPGTRDRIAGVFEVKSSDAHAWVEVWFPETGWQAFDPTASVPLSANSKIDSIGADLVEGADSYVRDHRLQIALLIAVVLGGFVSFQVIGELRYRRRRGRWGLLQDRFGSAAVRRGAVPGSPNPQLAAVWTDADDAEVARLVAERLDQAAFDPTFSDDRQVYSETSKLVGSLPRASR
jgi:hypothetical protein